MARNDEEKNRTGYQMKSGNKGPNVAQRSQNDSGHGVDGLLQCLATAVSRPQGLRVFQPCGRNLERSSCR